jgi:ankyrin repeat protein
MDLVRELAQLYPAALGVKNGVGDSPLHCAVKYSHSVELVRELISMYPAALEMTNEDHDTPLWVIACSNNNFFEEEDEILQMLLEAAPQTARIVVNPKQFNRLPLHSLIYNGDGSYSTRSV